MLAAHDIHFFETFGYLHLRGWMAADIAWIIEAFEEMWSRLPQDRHDGDQRSVFPAPVFVADSPRLATLLEHPRIIEVCRSLLGAGYGFHASDGNLYARDTGWHSDAFAQWPDKSTARHVKMAFYLDPLAREQGALRVIPGSHHEGDRFCESLQQELPDWLPDRRLALPGRDIPAVAIESQPGDLVCFDHRLMHAAFGGARRRRMFTLNWTEGGRTPAMRDALLAIYRFARDQGVDWTGVETACLRDAPPERMAVMQQIREFGRQVMEERTRERAPAVR